MSKNLINKKQLLAKVPYSDRHILTLEKRGEFPARIVLSARRVAWLESDIDQWIESRCAANGTAQGPHLYQAAA